jgi:hypothetical protein
MSRWFAFALALPGTALATITIDPGFWETYEPNHQYTEATLGDLAALDEGDLLDTERGAIGLVVRIVGRDSVTSALVSARIGLDGTARQRIQVKVVPFDLPRADPRPPQTYRRPVSEEQAAKLRALLERWDFWSAPYSLGRPDDAGDKSCESAGSWVIEGLESNRYQIIVRSTCGQLEAEAAELRDFLLGLASVAPE